MAQQRAGLHGSGQHLGGPQCAHHENSRRNCQRQGNVARLKIQPHRAGQQHRHHGNQRHAPMGGVRKGAGTHQPHHKKQNDKLRYRLLRRHQPHRAQAPHQGRKRQRYRIGPLPHQNLQPHRLGPKVQQVHHQPHRGTEAQHPQPGEQLVLLHQPPQRPTHQAAYRQALKHSRKRLPNQQGQRVGAHQRITVRQGRGSSRRGFGSGKFAHDLGSAGLLLGWVNATRAASPGPGLPLCRALGHYGFDSCLRTSYAR